MVVAARDQNSAPLVKMYLPIGLAVLALFDRAPKCGGLEAVTASKPLTGHIKNGQDSGTHRGFSDFDWGTNMASEARLFI